MRFLNDFQDSFSLKKYEEFTYFCAFINENNKSQDVILILKKEIVRDSLIEIKKTKFCNFTFFFLIFQQCYQEPTIIELINLFEFPSMIQPKEIINIESFNILFNDIFSNKKKLSQHCKEKKEGIKLQLKTRIISCYYYRYYDENRFVQMVVKESAHPFIVETIFNHYNNFNGMKEGLLTKLIPIATNFEEFKILLKL